MGQIVIGWCCIIRDIDTTLGVRINCDVVGDAPTNCFDPAGASADVMDVSGVMVKRLRLQERVKKLKQNVAKSKVANIKLVGDLEAKEEEIMSLNELLRQEELNNVAHEKIIMKQNREINTLKGTL